MGKFIDLVGQRFGRLVVKSLKSHAKDTRERASIWTCRCDCGKEIDVIVSSLTLGRTKSCGCFHKDIVSSASLKHGLSKSKIYKVWAGMKDRCYNTHSFGFKYYGGRGISVCDEWLNDFKSFYDWSMANGYTEGLTIDRINTNGNYEPNNCRWITRQEQAFNTRTTKHVKYKEKEYESLSQLSRELKIPLSTLRRKIKDGTIIIQEITRY